MLKHPTLDKLEELRLDGMARALREQMEMPDTYAGMTFDERLGLLVDREDVDRTNRRLRLRLKRAKLRYSNACVEDLDKSPSRKLDRRQLASLIGCGWIAERRNVLITGQTGTGKTYLACALANKACREGYSAFYARCTGLLRRLDLGRADGTYDKKLQQIARFDVLILDDWGLIPFAAAHRRHLYEVLEDRAGVKSTIVTSQYPPAKWHELLGEPTLADAIIDRVIHSGYHLALKGDSLRTLRATK